MTTMYNCKLYIFHYLQELILQRAICILGHTHDQKIYYTSMSEPCADYLGKQNIHYIITRIFLPCTESKTKLLFTSIFGNQCDMVGCRDFCSAYFPPRLGHKKWRLGWWSPFALTVLAPINLAWITFAEFTKSRIEFSRKIICMQICLEVNNR